MRTPRSTCGAGLPISATPGHHYAVRCDVVIIGSGFGGSVAALRLVEKGYSVAVIEAGRRFADDELPQTSWRVRRFLWAPALRCFGVQRLDLLPGSRGAGGVLVLSGAGVGGGSLNYANTLYRPLDDFYDDPQWRDIADWRSELAPHYDQASRVLGSVEYPRLTAADEAMRKVAVRLGVGDTFHSTPVGVFLGQPGQRVPDPYFGGAGPDRTGCLHCGSCMTGCRHGAKNTLVKNYLYLAEQAGASVYPLTTVTSIRPARTGSGYVVSTKRTGSWRSGGGPVFEADQVIFAAGALGTQRLLHRLRRSGALPGLSPRVGALTRTNSESLLGASVARRSARRRRLDLTDGVAITSSFHPDPRTHIEPVRYGKGSNIMGMLQTLLTDGGPRRPLRWLGTLARHPWHAARVLWLRGWSERTVIGLVMQSRDNSLSLSLRRAWYGRRRLVASAGHGEPNPSWIPVGNEAVRLLAEELDGVAGGSITEVFGAPVTAHILGGAVIGSSPADGVVDAYHRVFGHDGLHVVDGSAVSANLGVNPAMTIAAMAERALSFWPNKGEPDPRPSLGQPYVRLDPVLPRHPVVPLDAPAALR